MDEIKNTQSKFSPQSFSSNPERRCPVVIITDTSGSMSGQPIQELNAGLVSLKKEWCSHELAVKRIEACIVSFPPVRIEVNFQPVLQFTAPCFSACGETPLGAAILKALETIYDRVLLYKANGQGYYQPLIFLITDGQPKDNWQEAARRIHDGEAAKHFAFFAVGVHGADMDILKQISVREPLELDRTNFQEFFQWVSVKSIAASTPGSKLSLPGPGWTKK